MQNETSSEKPTKSQHDKTGDRELLEAKITTDKNVRVQLLVTSLEKVLQYGQLTSSARLSTVSCNLVVQSGAAFWCWMEGEPKSHLHPVCCMRDIKCTICILKLNIVHSSVTCLCVVYFSPPHFFVDCQ